jgi:hypothetical protein
MGVRDRLERIEKELSSLAEGRRRVFLCWGAVKAGVPLDTEASMDSLLSRIETFESGTAGRFLSELGTDLGVVRELRG